MAFLSRHRTLLLIVLCGLIALYALLGFFGVPYAVKTYGIPALSERLQHPVLLKEISFNPFTFAVTVSEFEIQQANQRPMLGFGELFVDFEATSIVRSSYLFEEIRLTFPFGFVHLPAEGKLNLLGLIPQTTDKGEGAESPAPSDNAEDSSMPPVDIRLLSITQGVIEYRDDTKRKPIMIDVVPIEITLQNFSTRRGEENAYAFTAEFGKGETLTWEGAIHLDPLQSTGKVSLSNVKLNTFWPSIRDQFHFEILSGAVQVDARYRFDMKATPFHLQLSDGSIALSDFRLASDRVSDPVIVLPSLELDEIRLDLPARDLGVGTIRTSGAQVRTWLEQDGAINFSGLFVPVAGEKETDPPASEDTAPWTVEVQKVEVAKTQVAFEDRSLKIPMNLAIDDLQATVTDIRWPSKGSLPITASLWLNKLGSLEIDGTVQIDPLQADLKLTLAHIGLRPFQPYLDQMVQLDVKEGELELEGEVQYRSRHEAEPLLRYQGQLGIDKLDVTDAASDKKLLGWTALDLSQIALEVAPTTVKIGEIALRDPAIQLVTAEDGTMNVTRALRSPEQVGTQQEPSKPVNTAGGKKEPPPIPISIDVVTLSNLSATYVDESIEPTVTTGISDLRGSIKGLSSKQVAKAEVSLSGKVDRVASLKIQGKINPLSELTYTDLKVVLDGMDLTAVSPYAGKYAGFPITKGKLSLDLKYLVSKKKLVGENDVLIDQLTFGKETDSPDATNLPVGLAVALLKDRRGRIDIDLPVRGDLSEPDFHYGQVVLDALVNLITKVATSPFAALGSLIGGSGEELQFIGFKPGSKEIEDAAGEKVETLIKALNERPALRLEVIGTADPKRDRDALATSKVEAELQRRFTQGGKTNLQATLSKDRELALLGDLYAEKLGKQPTKRTQVSGGESVERVLTAEEIRQQLVPAMTVEEGELRRLAQDRAKAIRETLMATGEMSEDRIFLVEAEVTASEGERIPARLNLTGG